MAIATILPTARTVFLDANNNPLAGGSVYFYIPSTTTLKTTWQDAAQTTPNTNPVILDGNGSALIYGSGQYKQSVYDASNNLVYTGLTQDVYGLITGSNNTFAGNNTFSGTNTFTNTVTLGSAASATTQAITDNSTLVATDAFVKSFFVANYAGGYVNKFRNPSFDIYQRGSSGTVSSGTSAYTADGWIVTATGANAAWSVSQTTASPPISGHYFSLSNVSGLTDVSIKQRIESSIAESLGGQQVTVQFYLNSVSLPASITPTLTVNVATATDNFSSITNVIGPVNMQTVASGASAVCAYTFAMPTSCYKGAEIVIDFAGSLNTGTTCQINLSQFDIRVTSGATTGLNNTPPIAEQRPIGIELLFCQRYFQAYGDISGVVGTGYSTSSTASGYYIPFKAPLRVKPTGLTVTTVADFEVVTYAGANVAALTGMTFNSTYSSNQGAFVTTTVASGLTSSTPYMLSANTALAGNLIFTGAEL